MNKKEKKEEVVGGIGVDVSTSQFFQANVFLFWSYLI